MLYYNCLYCQGEIPDETVNYETLGQTIECPHCDHPHLVEYEETNNGEEEYGWFYLSSLPRYLKIRDNI